MPKTYELPFVRGRVKIKLYDKNGNLKLHRDIKNIVVNSGLAYIASRMIGEERSVMTRMAVGDSSALQNPFDTDLISILGDKREFSSPPSIEGDFGERILYQAVFPPGVSTGAITESGVFSEEDVMLCRTTFPVVNKQEDDTIAIEWTISITNPDTEE